MKNFEFKYYEEKEVARGSGFFEAKGHIVGAAWTKEKIYALYEELENEPYYAGISELHFMADNYAYVKFFLDKRKKK